MKIDILKIIDRGIANKERLWLKVLTSTDLTHFVVFATSYTSPDSISNFPRNTYWFNSKLVKPGDSVVLYTKSGTESETINKDGTTTHFLYWGLNNTIWNKTDDCAVLLEVDSWQTSKRGE